MEQRTEGTIEYDPDPVVDAMLSSSVSHDEPAITRDLLREILRARRLGTSLSLLLITIGDTAIVEQVRPQLKKILMRIGDTLRHTDKCGLLSSYEILSVLPTTPYAGALIAAERVLKNGQSRRLATAGIRLDIGISALAFEDRAVEALVERARVAEKLSPEPLSDKDRTARLNAASMHV